MCVRKANIPSDVRAKFEQHGVEAIKSKLHYVVGVRGLDKQDDKEEALGDAVKASGREMREWLAEKAAWEALWVRVGVIAAIVAAVFGFLAWRFPFSTN